MIVKYETEKGEVSLSFSDVKKYICPVATDSEIFMFLNLCKYQKLNPFLREIYLIKYSANENASIVVGKETFLKIAQKNQKFKGFRAGIIIEKDGKIEYREGSFYTTGEVVVGGWAEVYMEGYTAPIRNEVSWNEYVGKLKDGSVSFIWRTKGATMIRKVALCQSLREAMPEDLGGLYSQEEINTIQSELPTEVIIKESKTKEERKEEAKKEDEIDIKDDEKIEIELDVKDNSEEEKEEKGTDKKEFDKVRTIKIKLLQRELGYDDEKYRKILNKYFKVSSSKELSPEQKEKLISMFEKQLLKRKEGGETA